MKDSQHPRRLLHRLCKYIKESNERFSTQFYQVVSKV